ncbi:MAG TPA: hypothetical protein VNW15_01205 [Rhizomicrobium sp.]|jgi:hypothetical protein|nr:hypothetical protein [Rhizomicrobium sp.]
MSDIETNGCANLLFHQDGRVDTAYLRSLARQEVERSSLIRVAAEGSAAAARALHVGFWPFVSEFEIAIDRHSLPRTPLRKKYGQRANKTFVWLASAIRQMKEEEGSHAAHWRKDAECLGVHDLSAPTLAGVRELIADAYSPDLPRFFSVLAGTEFIAEELSSFLVSSAAYTGLFSRKRWMWGEVHLAPHDHGPSHLEIDIDLARAYGPDTMEALENVGTMVQETITLFGLAAAEVESLIQSV